MTEVPVNPMDDAPPSLKAISLWDNRAEQAYDAGEYQAAEAWLRQAVSARQELLGPQHPDTLRTEGNLGVILWMLGDWAHARALQEEVLAAQEEVLGAEHPDTLGTKMSLANTIGDLGDLVEARKQKESVLAVQERVLGQVHPYTLRTQGNLATTLKDLGEFAEARALQETVLAAQEEVLGLEHRETLGTKGNLANTLFELGDFVRARALLKEVLAVKEKVLGSKHPDFLRTKANVAYGCYKQGDLSGARSLYEEVLSNFEEVLAEHPHTLVTRSNLALIVRELGDPTAARAMLESILEARERILGPNHPETIDTRDELANTLDLLEGKPAQTSEAENSNATFRSNALSGSTLSLMGNSQVDQPVPSLPYGSFQLFRRFLFDTEKQLQPPYNNALIQAAIDLALRPDGVYGSSSTHQLRVALRTLGLVEETSGVPTRRLVELLEAISAEDARIFRTAFRTIIVERYDFLLATQDPKTGHRGVLARTLKELDQEILAFNITDSVETARKVRTFFLRACEAAGIPTPGLKLKSQTTSHRGRPRRLKSDSPGPTNPQSASQEAAVDAVVVPDGLFTGGAGNLPVGQRLYVPQPDGSRVYFERTVDGWEFGRA